MLARQNNRLYLLIKMIESRFVSRATVLKLVERGVERGCDFFPFANVWWKRVPLFKLSGRRNNGVTRW
jgi:hypothetical protein